ncbi:hypothetical protein AB1L42_22275 [Thalassoglobus sp. JC818]|uniref:hypothetical protein n=1 Tax=Thalassoglobus sp. JC818 TaxID=3232136 RepID=UPI00345A15F8
MAPRKKRADDSDNLGPSKDFSSLQHILGYLNYSGGTSDPKFLDQLNQLWKREISTSETSPSETLESVFQTLHTGLIEMAATDSAFEESKQAHAVLELAVRNTLPAYQTYHSDLLFHQSLETFCQPFFLGKIFEAVLQQGGPWNEERRIVDGAIATLNDFVGYRPVAVLENGRKMDVYAHERHRPLPLFIPGAGAAECRYAPLIERAMQFLEEAPQDLLQESFFSLDHLDELACDLRAYDHLNPIFKRTNYMFGEWDPHQIDSKGFYRRFVIRQIILDSLCDWIEEAGEKSPQEERLFDASAALCGTMLMASSISGAGPGMHDSTVSLTTLLPIVAERRDAFYTRILTQLTGSRAKRLHQEAVKHQQPFGHVRQYLNMKLAGYGARQVQHRELAHLYAVMGYAPASRQQANAIPASSIRIETEIECTIASAHQALDLEDVTEAVEFASSIPDLLERGVQCGALVDPWNILGFQGQFPLFTAREDSIPDSRIEILMGLMEATFNVFSRTLGEAGAKGLQTQREEISVVFERLAHWWDKFGSDVIEDLPDVDGHESWESATHVAEALKAWRSAGESAGDISFWRERVDQFQSAQSYALVVDALLSKKDSVAAMGLLMQWLSQMEEVGFESPQHSIFSLLIRWMKLATGDDDAPVPPDQSAASIRRMFAFLEANAEEWWSVPIIRRTSTDDQQIMPGELEFGELDDEEDFEEADGEDELFSAAYDGMVFRDSAEDGQWSDTVDDDSGSNQGEFEALNRELEPRLKFLNAVGQLWQMAAASFARASFESEENYQFDEQTVDALISWHRQSQRWQIDLAELMESVWDREVESPIGDHDGNVEYDIQLQVKFYLLHQIINTLICLRNSERLLNGIIPESVTVPRGTEQDRRLALIYRAVVQRDESTVRELLPSLLSRLARNPLLYIPFESGGDPGQILRTQALQSVVRFLLRELPKLGMLRETWHLLYTAFRMERKWRPKGQAITEFDRLFTIALRGSLNALVNSVHTWAHGKLDTEDLIDAISRVLDPYQWLWSEHSRTMRISAVDVMRKEEEWEDLAEFIQDYGRELFHASHLTLGNVRAILHNGVDWFLDYLEEEQDPIHPMKLLDDIDTGIIDREHAEWCLEQVYSIIVDRFDRFLEYNTTTTQSDYGEMIYCLLEFLRLEARYDRDAWNLTPLTLVHEVLVRNSLLEAAEVWESTFEMQTADLADQHLQDLRRLQKLFGMRMPTITDHLRERFVKPLAVNRMLSLVEPAVSDARSAKLNSDAFEMLQEEVDEYLDDCWGSGVDIPDWLQALEREVSDASQPDEGGRPGTEADLNLPTISISRKDFLGQARRWKENLGAKNRPKSSKPDPEQSSQVDDKTTPDATDEQED